MIMIITGIRVARHQPDSKSERVQYISADFYVSLLLPLLHALVMYLIAHNHSLRRISLRINGTIGEERNPRRESGDMEWTREGVHGLAVYSMALVVVLLDGYPAGSQIYSILLETFPAANRESCIFIYLFIFLCCCFYKSARKKGPKDDNND